MKYIPNMLSIMRIILSLFLLLLEPLSFKFWFLYFICGMTDIFDGVIARRFHVTSKLGESIDSIGDIVMLGVLAYILLPIMTFPFWVFIWIMLITVIKICSIALGFYKFHTFISIHTYGNKITGLLLFCYIPFYVFNIFTIGLVFLGMIATLAAVEEWYIISISVEINKNEKGIFLRKP